MLEAEARRSSASKIKQLADRIANTTCRLELADAVNAPIRGKALNLAKDRGDNVLQVALAP